MTITAAAKLNGKEDPMGVTDNLKDAARVGAPVAAAIVAGPGGMILGALGVAYQAWANSSSPTKDNQSLDSLREERARKELEANILVSKAKAAQELAIAQRIANADEVEIEEYFEGSGQGDLGLKASEKGVTLGASGSGQRITKRVIKFKGFAETPTTANLPAMIEQTFDPIP